MASNSLKTKIEKVLSDCSSENTFWTNDKRPIRNIYQLASAIEDMDDYNFNYHVNEERDDFSLWVDETLEDHQLAMRLREIKDKQRYVILIRGRIAQLKSC